MGLFGTGLYGTGLYGIPLPKVSITSAVSPYAVLNPQVLNPLDKQHLLVTWEIPPNSNLDTQTLYFDVYRGRVTDFSKAKKVNRLPVLSNQYMDEIPESLREPWYYFVVAVGRYGATPTIAAEASQYSFTPRDADDNMRYIISEWVRRHNLMLSMDGENFIYYLRKWSGRRCKCYDPIRQDTVDPNCQDCFGTTFIGGYYAIRAVGRFVAAQETLTRKELGLEINSDPTGWTTIYPLVTSQDLIRRQNNIIYRVTQVSPQIHKGILTRQGWNMHELERGLLEYSLPTKTSEVVSWSPYKGTTVIPVLPISTGGALSKPVPIMAMAAPAASPTTPPTPDTAVAVSTAQAIVPPNC